MKHLRSITGFLLPSSIWLFNRIHKCLTILGWIECLRKEKTGRTGVEIYSLVCLALLISFVFILSFPIFKTVEYIFTGLVLFHLFDIVVTTIHLSFFRNEAPQYPSRALILITINYIEIILIFSIVNFVYTSSFATIWDSLQFSFELFVPLVSIDSRRLLIPYWFFVIEIVVSLIIHITIIQRVLSYFKH